MLNFVLLGPMIQQKLDLKRELRGHALGQAAATLVGGYSRCISNPIPNPNPDSDPDHDYKPSPNPNPDPNPDPNPRYNNYISLSDTAVHRMVGGRNRYSCYAAAAVGLLFLVAYPLAGIVGYVPNLVIAAI